MAKGMIDLGSLDLSLPIFNPAPVHVDPREGLAPGTPSADPVTDRERGKGIYYPGDSPSPPPPSPPAQSTPTTAPPAQSTPTPAPPAPPPPVKIPDRDVLNFTRNDISATGIATLLFENIGGIEISTLTRRDTVEGQNPYYSLISNLSTIRTQYDPTQLISRQKPNQTLFDIFPISLSSKIPGDLYLDQRNLENFFYIASNGDFVIELDNLLQDENIQLEIAGSGTIKMVNGS